MAWSRGHNDVSVVLGDGHTELACDCYYDYRRDYADYYYYRRPLY